MAKTEEGRRRRHFPPPPGAYPWLVFYHGRGLRNQTFCSISNPNNSYVRSVPELRNKEILNCCHGWLILSQENNRFFSLWNPVSFESILLPPLKLPSRSWFNAWTLSSPPSDPNSMVLLFDRAVQSIWFCRLEDRQWIEKLYSMEIKAMKENTDDSGEEDYLGKPVSCNGKLYATTFRRSKMLSIDIIDEPNGGGGGGSLVITSLNKKLPFSWEALSPCRRRDFIESCGELFVIETLYGGTKHDVVIGIDIFKLDFSSMNWERVKSAKDRVFFLCNHYAFSCSSTICSEIKGNRVYFTRDEDKGLYSYDIGDGSISLSLPCPNLRTPWKSPTWIMPDFRLANFFGEALHTMTGKEDQKEEQGSGVIRIEVAEQEKNEEKREAKETHLFSLPSDILRSISELLILVDYMNFRAVSTSCRLVAPPIKWRTAMSGLETSQSQYSLSPWLLVFEKSEGICSLFDPKHGNRFFVRLPESLQDATLCHCKEGWLLMCKSQRSSSEEGDDDQQCLIFFNPFTKEIIPYPPLPRLPFAETRFDFSSAPNSPYCVVVAAVFFFGNVVNLHVSHSREEEWSYIDLSCNPIFSPSYNVPIIANGAFYFLGLSGCLGVLRIEDDDHDYECGCHWEVLEKPQEPCNSLDQNFLAECNGELLSVFTDKRGKRVQIFKFCRATMVWDRVQSLGNHSLYLSRTSALSRVAGTPKMEDQIYFPRFYGQDIVSYSLRTGHYHSSGSEEGSPKDFYGTREHLICGWIEPRWY